MKNAHHTPGPWGCTPQVNTDHVFHVHRADGNFLEKEASYDQMQANARLIAAAPHLLKALKALVHATKDFECSDVPDSIYVPFDKKWNEAREAIAKAEGK